MKTNQIVRALLAAVVMAGAVNSTVVAMEINDGKQEVIKSALDILHDNDVIKNSEKKFLNRAMKNTNYANFEAVAAKVTEWQSKHPQQKISQNIADALVVQSQPGFLVKAVQGVSTGYNNTTQAMRNVAAYASEMMRNGVQATKDEVTDLAAVAKQELQDIKAGTVAGVTDAMELVTDGLAYVGQKTYNGAVATKQMVSNGFQRIKQVVNGRQQVERREPVYGDLQQVNIQGNDQPVEQDYNLDVLFDAPLQLPVPAPQQREVVQAPQPAPLVELPAPLLQKAPVKIPVLAPAPIEPTEKIEPSMVRRLMANPLTYVTTAVLLPVIIAVARVATLVAKPVAITQAIKQLDSMIVLATAKTDKVLSILVDGLEDDSLACIAPEKFAKLQQYAQDGKLEEFVDYANTCKKELSAILAPATIIFSKEAVVKAFSKIALGVKADVAVAKKWFAGKIASAKLDKTDAQRA